VAEKTYTFKSVMVRLMASDQQLAAAADNLKLCVFHSTICLGWTQCHLQTHCHGATLSGCGFRTIGCPGGSVLGGQLGGVTPVVAAACGWGTGCVDTVDCGGTGHPQFDPRVNPAAYVRQVAELKADLRAALAEVEAHEKTLGDVAKPSSLEEANQLESGLKEALKDVEAMKTQLRGKKGT
jgi:hypothetical protein